MKRFNVFDKDNMYIGYVIAKTHEKAVIAAQNRYGEQMVTVALAQPSGHRYDGLN